jgi:hypothetical protein
MAIEHVFLRVFLFSPENHHSTIVPYSFLPLPDVCDSPDQAASYHILSLQVWRFISDPTLG